MTTATIPNMHHNTKLATSITDWLRFRVLLLHIYENSISLLRLTNVLVQSIPAPISLFLIITFFSFHLEVFSYHFHPQHRKTLRVACFFPTNLFYALRLKADKPYKTITFFCRALHALKNTYSRSGVGNLRPAGRIRPAKQNHPAPRHLT